jgi:hypothetical protein
MRNGKNGDVELNEYKILQIMPAEGWYAVYKWENGDSDMNRITCWGLVEWEDGDRTVEGVEVDDGETHLCVEYSGFRHYLHQSEIETFKKAETNGH